MSVQPKARMNVDEFLAWAEGRPGRYELLDGEVHAMSPERVRHVRTKATIFKALEKAIEAHGLPCEVFLNGLTVRVDRSTAYEPDALVVCGSPLDDDGIEAPAPVVVVEILSPSTGSIDKVQKLDGYFRVPSVMHYLILDPKRRLIVHHRRGSGAMIETYIASSGTLDLSPPGFALALDDVFASILTRA